MSAEDAFAASHAAIGDNNPPPTTLEEHVAALDDGLIERHRALLDVYVDLEDRAMIAVEVVETEAQAQLVTQLAGDLRNAETKFADGQKAEKAPWLRGGQAVDAFFNSRAKNLESRRKGLLDRVNVYLRKKAEIERQAALRRAQEERDKAEQARKDAEAMRAQERHHEADAHAQAADKAERAADVVETKAEAKSGAAVRTEGGATSFQKTERIYEITDHDAVRASLGIWAPFMTSAEVSAALWRAARTDPWPTIPGVTFSTTTTANVRAKRS